MALTALREPPRPEVSEPVQQPAIMPGPEAVTALGMRPVAARRHVLQACRTAAPLLLVDLGVLGLAMVATGQAVGLFVDASGFAFGRHLMALWTMALVVFPCLGLYPASGLNPVREVRQTVLAVLASFALLSIAILTIGKFSAFELRLLPVACAAAVVAGPLSRLIARSLLGRCSWWGQAALIIGDEAHGAEVHDALTKAPSLGLRPTAVINPIATTPHGLSLYLGPDHRVDAADLVPSPLSPPQYSTAFLSYRDRASWAIVTMPDRPAQEVNKTIELCEAHFPNVVVVPKTTGIPSLWTTTQDYGGLLGIRFRPRLLMPSKRFAKRMMDVVLVLAGGLLVLPLVLLICLLIRVFSPGPAFYGHERIGRNGRRFKAWKFRTMVPDADQVLESYLEQHPELREEWEKDHKLKNDPRIIPGIGNLLRTLSLDELPQLWNVLCGDMSLVGPRPIVTAEIEKYDEVFPLYLRVTPGITGLWQVSGRNNTTYEERIGYDAYYVRNWSLWLDLYLLCRTVKTVALREGAY